MRTITIYGEKDLRVVDGQSASPGPGEVRIDIINGGICGSDLHYYQHGGIGDTIRVREPMILGHEVSGKVAELGSGVDAFAVGDLVAISPSRPCYNCACCRLGRHNHCENMRFYGSAMPFPHIQGPFANLWSPMPANASRPPV